MQNKKDCFLKEDLARLMLKSIDKGCIFNHGLIRKEEKSVERSKAQSLQSDIEN
jgi:hypothetical protein